MNFIVVEPSQLPSQSRGSSFFLVKDNWDDWGKYRTQFNLYFFDASGKRHSIGEVKIGQKGLKPGRMASEGVRAPSLPSSFESLPETFFSLGQTDSYYEELNTLAAHVKSHVLNGLRDIAFNLDLLSEFKNEDVTNESLLRHVRIENVTGRLHRLSLGDATLTAFDFSFAIPGMNVEGSENDAVSFSVVPETVPPTNVHALIGRNGVGKTKLIQNIVFSVLNTNNGSTQLIKGHDSWGFSGIISVSFSAFDDIEFPTTSNSGMPVNFVGLRDRGSDGQLKTKTPSQLSEEFVECLKRCFEGAKRDRWRITTHGLYGDPVFADANPLQLLDVNFSELDATASEYFKRLSSGHKIVLLTVTKLVDLVAEKTLILLDEPEGHLHPPLLSALVRSVSRLLSSRNGVAIIATHSPVVLQEVPRDCTWIIHRSGRYSKAERPEIETFAENVSVLTRQVFGLEVTHTGFMKMIQDAVSVSHSYEQLMQHFGGKLGTEGRLIARSLMAARDRAEPSK
ncbi:AAA family ATPase [Xanthomonas campestris]|uniref:AAA family ATPase n=1 Tax=Xanthomonas campestris TaxID=339 RepID=UPI001D14BB3E|nr:AAA family ATPase [Xanthomonas campestris]MCC3254484.1 AAA family ATPase [Xanthomonas campestris pv. armoraciae]